MAIYYGHTKPVEVDIADARNRLTQLVRAVEEGESIVITRNGKPVAQLVPPPSKRR
jgi:prevent-host-death family protein